MKPSYFIIILLAAALAYTTYRLITATPSDTTDADSITSATAKTSANTVYNSVMTRSSVRSYNDRDISESLVDTLLHAAMAAPTAMNRQPWQFIVIRDRAILDSIAACCKNISMAADARLAIAVCGDMSLAIEGEGREFWIQDCSAATENLLIAAHASGLGAVWCGIYPINERVEFIRDILSLPENIIPLNIIPIGYPSAQSSPKDKYKSDRIHTDRY